MRVLFITRKFPPRLGGMETLSKGLADNLPQIATTRLFTYGGSQLWLPFVMFGFWIRMLFAAPSVEIVILGDAVLSPLGWFAKKVLRKPVVCLVHGLDLTYPPTLYQAYLRVFSFGFDAYICNSRATQKEARRRGYNPLNIALPAIDQTEEIPTQDARRLLTPILHETLPHDAFVLGFLGRASKRKGLSWFLKNVFPHTPEHVHLLVAGSTPKEEILNLISDPSLLSRLHVVGRIPDEMQSLFFSSLDLFLMPNIAVQGDQEGFGIVAIEASSHGTPVLAADLEGIQDAVQQGQTGWLVTSEDAGAFGDAIRHLSSPIGADELETVRHYCSKNTLQRFSWKKRIMEYQRILSPLASSRPQE